MGKQSGKKTLLVLLDPNILVLDSYDPHNRVLTANGSQNPYEYKASCFARLDHYLTLVVAEINARSLSRVTIACPFSDRNVNIAFALTFFASELFERLKANKLHCLVLVDVAMMADALDNKMPGTQFKDMAQQEALSKNRIRSDKERTHVGISNLFSILRAGPLTVLHFSANRDTYDFFKRFPWLLEEGMTYQYFFGNRKYCVHGADSAITIPPALYAMILTLVHFKKLPSLKKCLTAFNDQALNEVDFYSALKNMIQAKRTTLSAYSGFINTYDNAAFTALQAQLARVKINPAQNSDVTKCLGMESVSLDDLYRLYPHVVMAELLNQKTVSLERRLNAAQYATENLEKMRKEYRRACAETDTVRKENEALRRQLTTVLAQLPQQSKTAPPAPAPVVNHVTLFQKAAVEVKPVSSMNIYERITAFLQQQCKKDQLESLVLFYLTLDKAKLPYYFKDLKLFTPGYVLAKNATEFTNEYCQNESFADHHVRNSYISLEWFVSAILELQGKEGLPDTVSTLLESITHLDDYGIAVYDGKLTTSTPANVSVRR